MHLLEQFIAVMQLLVEFYKLFENIDEVNFVIILLTHNLEEKIAAVTYLGLKSPVEQVQLERTLQGKVFRYP